MRLTTADFIAAISAVSTSIASPFLSDTLAAVTLVLYTVATCQSTSRDTTSSTLLLVLVSNLAVAMETGTYDIPMSRHCRPDSV